MTGSFCADGAARQGVCPDGTAPIVRDFTQPGLYYHGRWGALSLMSLGIALIFGTAGPAAHPGALLHGALGAGGAHVGGLGDDPDRHRSTS